jgi:hypothetical protein
MSNRAERIAEDDYERNNDLSPVTGSFTDDSYAKETHTSLRDHVPVLGDNEQIEDPIQPPYSNSDQQLGKSRVILTSIAVNRQLTKYRRGRKRGDR